MPESIEPFIRYLGWVPGLNQFNVMTFKPVHNGPVIKNESDLAAADAFIEEYNGKQSLYVNLNPVKVGTKKGKPKDADVIESINAYIDIDRVDHPEFEHKDYPATDDELDMTKLVAGAVLTKLKEVGIEYPMTDMTGNGYRIIIPTIGLTKKVHQAFLKKLEDRFGASIDTAMFDPSRVTGIPGTINVKLKVTDDRWLRVRTPWMPQERKESDVAALMKYMSNAQQKLTDVPTERLPTLTGTKVSLEEAMIVDDEWDSGMLRKLISGDRCKFTDRSRAEQSLADRLVYYNFTESEIRDILINKSNLGKAAERDKRKGDNYVSVTIEKAFQKMTERYEDFSDWEKISDNSNDWGNTERRLDTTSYDGFIQEYIHYASGITDAFTEYHYVAALMIISSLVERQKFINLNQEIIHPNLYVFVLGLSTSSRKSASVKIMNRLMQTNGWGALRYLPSSFSYEGFVEEMSEDSNRILVVDEAGSLLKNMQKKYATEIKDLLCHLYGGEDFYRKLRSKKEKHTFNIIDPFLSIFLATTPDTLYANSDIGDNTSGWFARFLFVHPRYDRKRRAFERLSEATVVSNKETIRLMNDVSTWIEKNPGEMEFDDDAFEYYQKWQIQIDDRMIERNDEYYNAVMGRMFGYVLKIALLHAVSRKTNVILKIDLENAIHAVETFFLPTSLDVMHEIEQRDTVDITARKIAAIERYMKKHGGKATRRELLKAARTKVKDFTEIIDSLVQAGVVRAVGGEDKGKNTTVSYCLQSVRK